MAKKNQSSKMRKVGRNSADCKAYANSNRREKNKLARLKKVLERNPNDKNAADAADRCVKAIRGY